MDDSLSPHTLDFSTGVGVALAADLQPMYRTPTDLDFGRGDPESSGIAFPGASYLRRTFSQSLATRSDLSARTVNLSRPHLISVTHPSWP